MAGEAQRIPVRVYDAEEHVVLAAPLPGLEPEDISIAIAGNTVHIRGEERGPGQRRRNVIVDEWTIGPYEREVELPQAVDGPLTNATYGNGVLVLSMPKATKDQPSETSFRLHPIECAHGEWVGHAGMELRPKSMAEHEKKHREEKRDPSPAR